MAKFMVLYTAPVSAEQQMNVSPEEMQKGMQPWFDWFARVGSAMVDQGMPLGNGTSITNDASKPSDLKVAGYSIIEADDMSKAKELLAGHPHLSFVPGAGIEVFEYLPLPGM
jgi:hypothetical protein